MKPTLENLEIHLAHACNLACSNCSHFSNYGFAGILDIEDAKKDLSTWAQRLAPRQFSLVGGEPTLNPNLTRFVRVAREQFPDCPKIVLVSNGWFLHKHPDLPAALAECDVQLEVSIHHDGDAYRSKFSEILHLLSDWCSAHSLTVKCRRSHTRWRRLFLFEGKDLAPYEDGRPDQSWANCPARTCMQLHEGRLWKCPPVAYLPMMHKRFSLSDKWAPYLAYQPLDPTCSDAELEEFVSRKAEPVCSMCPAEIEYFELPSPIRNEQRRATSPWKPPF